MEVLNLSLKTNKKWENYLEVFTVGLRTSLDLN